MVKLYVGGFPLDTTEMEIVQLVSLHATVSTIKIVRDKKTRQSKGYAFLELTDRAGLDAAVDALDGYMLHGKELRFNMVEEAPPEPVRSYVKVAPRAGGPPKKMRPRRNT